VVAFGQVGKNLKMRCVGLPNVGKSSLSNLLTEQSAVAENYPFYTIKPNEARCAVPGERYVYGFYFFGSEGSGFCGGFEARVEVLVKGLDSKNFLMFGRDFSSCCYELARAQLDFNS
jgi:hypothetical protein